MKVFLLTLCFWFCFATELFAEPVAAKQNVEPDAQQKMAQLQSLIAKTMQGGDQAVVAPSVNNKPTQVTAIDVTNLPATNNQNANSVPPAKPAIEEQKPASSAKAELYDQAFAGVVNQMLPMSPEQIAKLKEVFSETQMAAATPPGIPPKPTSTSLLISLAPQASPPVIRLGAGYITSLVFVDSTGQPWPIASYSIGDPSAFNIQWDRKGNTLLVQSMTFYKRSNLAVILRDLNTPIMITLLSGQDAVDYRVDLRVPGVGPNAIFMQNGIPEAANPILLDVLNGIQPKSSKELKVRGGDCQAWLLKDKLYLRTSLNLLSPGWQSVMSSIDGTHAYQLQPSPLILASQNGRDKILKLTLEGLE